LIKENTNNDVIMPLREKGFCRELLLLRPSEYSEAGKLWTLEAWKRVQNRQLLN